MDPICLNVKLVDTCSCNPCNCCDMDLTELPNFICGCFDDDLVLGGDEKRIYATLGQFSIIRLERDTQLIIPCYDFCVPEKECVGSTDDNPCELFSRIKFPVDEFFPPVCSSYDEYRDAKQHCCR